jgi:hypothetical protein
MTFGSPLAYRSSCVPLALAALLDLPEDDVATMLWRAGAARRLPSAPGLGSSAFGTPVHGAADVVTRLGWSVAWWWGAGTEILADRVYLRELAFGRASAVWGELERPAPPPARDDPRPEPLPAADALTVEEWARRFPGRWLLVVPVAGVAVATHALGVRDGELVAGGPGYDDARVIHAYRVTPPPPPGASP